MKSLGCTDKGGLRDFFLNDYVQKITIYYHNQSGYESQVINLIEMFGQEFVIEQTGTERIVFEQLQPAVEGKLR